MRNLIFGFMILSSSAAFAELGSHPSEFEDREPMLTTFRVTYDTSGNYTDSVRDAFVNMTNLSSVGDALDLIAQSSNVKNVECNPEMCKVSWSDGSSGEAGGKIEGSGIIGGVGGELTGKGARQTSFSVEVPCHMLFETIQKIRKVKKDDN